MIALLVHAGAFSGTEFTFDDAIIVRDNPRLNVDSAAELGALIKSKYWGDRYQSERLWRPVPMLSFAFDRALWGRADPDRSRWTSLMLHALTCLCVWLLFGQLLGRRGALLGALLFAAHPVHAESTVGVVGRSEVLALLGATAGMLLHLRARRATRSRNALLLYLAACGCFFAGFASKEIALTAPFVLVVVEVALRRQPPPEETQVERRVRHLVLAAPYLLHLLTIAAYFFCRVQVLGDLFPKQGAQTLGALTLGVRLLVAGDVYFASWGAVLWPQLTSAHYPFHLPVYTQAAAKLFIHVLVGLSSLWFLSRHGRRARAFGLGILGFYLSLGPVSNIIPIGVVRADRLLYTPSLYGCLTVAVAVNALVRFRNPRSERIAWAFVLALLLGGYTWRNQANVRAWTNNELLWRTSLRRFPGEPRAHLALGQQLLNRRGVDPSVVPRAREHLFKAAQGFQPNRAGWPKQAAQARCLYAQCIKDERPQQAEALFLQAQALDPNCDLAALGLANLYLERAAQEPNPSLRQLHLSKAERVAASGAQHVAPHSYDLWLLWGTTLTSLPGRDQQAEMAFSQAIRRHPDPWQALFNRARLRRLGTKDLQGALDDYRRVVAILSGQPGLSPEMLLLFPKALFYKGWLELKLGLPEEAQRSHGQLLRMFPSSEDAAALRKLRPGN